MPWWRTQGYYDSAGWRGTWALDGGGALMNQAIHPVDLLVWLLGEPVEVSAFTGTLAHEGIEVEDTAVAAIRFAGGALGVVHATTAAYPGLTARVQVHGDRGSAVIDGDRLLYFHTADGAAEGAAAGAADGAADGGPDGNQAGAVLPGDADRAGAPGGDPMGLNIDGHISQYRDFVDAITTGRPPLVTPADATRTLGTILAVYASARTGRPVTLR
jgi:predicted dehydrogenase